MQGLRHQIRGLSSNVHVCIMAPSAGACKNGRQEEEEGVCGVHEEHGGYCNNDGSLQVPAGIRRLLKGWGQRGLLRTAKMKNDMLSLLPLDDKFGCSIA